MLFNCQFRTLSEIDETLCTSKFINIFNKNENSTTVANNLLIDTPGTKPPINTYNKYFTM